MLIQSLPWLNNPPTGTGLAIILNQLSFLSLEHAGGDNGGVILDRVRCTVPDRNTLTGANGNGSLSEPGTIALIGLGLAGLGFVRRK